MAKEIKIQLSFDTLADIISQLPPEALIELRRQIDTQLSSPTDPGIRPGIEAVEDTEFWNSELGQMILEEADDRLSHEEIRQALSSIKGSLSDDVIAEREER